MTSTSEKDPAGPEGTFVRALILIDMLSGDEYVCAPAPVCPEWLRTQPLSTHFPYGLQLLVLKLWAGAPPAVASSGPQWGGGSLSVSFTPNKVHHITDLSQLSLSTAPIRQYRSLYNQFKRCYVTVTNGGVRSYLSLVRLPQCHKASKISK